MRNTPRLPSAWLMLLLLSNHFWGMDGFSTGAPSGACSSMTPSHSSNTPQTSQAPFQITPGGVSVDSGAKITVILAAVSPTDKFKGFFIQARDSNTSQPIGTFVTSQHKYVTCSPGFNNAITHRGKTDKASVVVEWAAPANYAGEVSFSASVVEQYNRFWTGIISEKVTVKRSVPDTASVAPTAANPVTQAATTTAGTTPAAARGSSSTRRRGLLGNFRGRTNAPTTAPPTTEAPTTPARVRIAGLDGSIATSAIDNIFLGCSINKGCFGLPEGCKDNCDSMMTYTKTATGYVFELMRKIAPQTPNQYIAGALSLDDEMGDDSVMSCRSYNGVVDISMAWNVDHSSSNFLSNPTEGLSDYQMQQVDGKIYCRFTRATRLTISKKVFDLDNANFYLMVAVGSLTADGNMIHHDSRTVSNKATSLSAFETLDSTSKLFVTLHACFMVVAWVGAASSGILLARYFKQTWKNYKACGIDQWFHFHRLFMGTTWALTVTGFVLVAIYLKGWTSVPATTNPHAYIGIVSIALCFIQPFMAMFRCAPTDSRRPIFNWAHWFVGNCAQILGVTAIFFGLELHGMPRWTWWIMIVFVGFHCIVHIILSIGECVSDSKSKNQVAGIPMKEFKSSRDMLNPPDDKILDAPGATFRKAMLGLYLVVIWLVVILLVVVIAVGETQLDDWGLIFWDEEKDD